MNKLVGLVLHHELSELTIKDPIIATAHNIKVDLSHQTKVYLFEQYESISHSLRNKLTRLVWNNSLPSWLARWLDPTHVEKISLLLWHVLLRIKNTYTTTDLAYCNLFFVAVSKFSYSLVLAIFIVTNIIVYNLFSSILDNNSYNIILKWLMYYTNNSHQNISSIYVFPPNNSLVKFSHQNNFHLNFHSKIY